MSTVTPERRKAFRGVWDRYRRYVVIVAALIAVAVAVSTPYTSQLLALILIYALAVAGWNIVSGYAGQPSLGHAAFFGLGAYGAAVCTAELEVSPWLGIAVGATAAGLLAMLVGWVSWRLKIQGIYFALILFAVSELLLVVVANIDFLGGTTGLFAVGGEDSLLNLTFSDPRWFILLAAVALAITLLGTVALSRSPFGRELAVVRHDEVAAEASGINTMRVKVIALGISAVVTAVAGGLYMQLQLFIQPETVFGMTTNLRFILIGFLGGAGALFGPLLGSTVVTVIESTALEVFRGLPGIDGIAFGLLLVVAVSFLPRGIAWRRSVATRPEGGESPVSPAAGTPRGPNGATGVIGGRRVAGAPRREGDRQLVLSTEGLTKRFGGLTVVDGAALELRSGTVHGLIGPNGAGKTTLINMVTGTTSSDGGDIVMDGHSLLGRPPYAFARAGVVRTFQIPRALGDLTVRESVFAAAFASGRSTDPEASTDRALEVVDLLPHAHRAWMSLNGSQQRRAEVARALAQEPRVLLLDEPMAGLGSEEIDAMAEVLRGLPESHPDMSILFVEHLMRIMMALADEITVLDRGKVIATGTPQQIAADKSVISAYLGSSV